MKLFFSIELHMFKMAWIAYILYEILSKTL